MPRRSRTLHLASVAILSVAMACAQAVELGEVAVRSYIGQPLVADIELTGFSGDDIPVEVRLARPDVYLGANIAMTPVLQSLRMSVMRRDGRQFLHITSVVPVDAQHLNLFLDLSDAGRRSIRAATLWLAPDPKPAPIVVPAAVAPVAVAPVVAKAVSPPIGPAAAPAPVRTAARPAVAAPVRPPAPAVATRAAAAPAPAPAAACPKPRYSDEQVRACAARDYKNAVLTAQIVELEEKVKVLQSSLDPEPVARPPVPAAPAAVRAAVQPPIHAIKQAPEAKVATRPAVPPPIRTLKRKPAAEAGSPAPASTTGPMPRWAWNLIALLAATGAVAAVVAKRMGTAKMAPAESPPPAKAQGKLIGRLKDALHRDKKTGGDDADTEDQPKAA